VIHERPDGARHDPAPLMSCVEPVPDARGAVVPVDAVEAYGADDAPIAYNRRLEAVIVGDLASGEPDNRSVPSEASSAAHGIHGVR
jgi:hypothetical protein